MGNDLSEEQELALWMLGEMGNSETFLDVLRKARMAQTPDVLDTPDYVARHSKRLKPLFQGRAEEKIEMPAEAVAALTAVIERDVLSSPEEMLEKAIEAYLKLHPKGEEDLPPGWRSTIASAEAEIRGVTKGAFQDGFVADLASMARAEKMRAVEAERSRNHGRGRE